MRFLDPRQVVNVYKSAVYAASSLAATVAVLHKIIGDFHIDLCIRCSNCDCDCATYSLGPGHLAI